jgi:ribosome maturation factor RimP
MICVFFDRVKAIFMENLNPQSEPFVTPQNLVEQQVAAVVLPIVASQKCELVRVRVTGQKGHATLALYIDTLEGATPITMEQLEFLNRLMGDALDVADAEQKLFSGSYQLEVSSPGLDRPLSKVSHFKKAIGKLVRLKTDGQLGRPKALTGTLLEVDDAKGINVSSKVDAQLVQIPWDAIRDSHVVYEFEKSSKKRR